MRPWLALALIPALACEPKPDPARVKLLHHLKDQRAAQRIVAIQELAPHANQEETAAIMKASQDATSDVRVAVAIALGKVDAENAIDLTATLLRDPSDEVRAAAITTLAGRGGHRALSYIAHAYATGGPRVRAAIAATGAEVLANAVKVEAQELASDRERRTKDPHEMIRAEALIDLGSNSTAAGIAELTARLVDNSPTLAAAACRGLGEAGAVDQLPFVLQAVKAGRPIVTAACAYSVLVLDPTHALDLLVGQLAGADAATTGALLDLLENMKLSDSALEGICQATREQADGPTALRAATIVGPRCAVSSDKHPATWSRADTLRIWAALAWKDASTVKEARAALGDKDAHLAAAAASYLGTCGAPTDSSMLLSTASTELSALDFARAQIAKKAADQRAAVEQKESEQDQQMRLMLGPQYNQLAKLQPHLKNKIVERLKRNMGPDVPNEFEQRPGAAELISACVISSMRLGGDVSGFASVLFDEKDVRLRLLALEFANAVPAKMDPLRALARSDSDQLIQRTQFIHDLQAGDLGAIEHLNALAADARPDGRLEIAQALSPVATKAIATLIGLTKGEDSAVPVAVEALARVSGEEVEKALLARLDDPRGLGASAAIAGLHDRAGATIDAALVRAAVHPSAEVREAALQALTARKTCASTASLAALREDYVGAVRKAATDLVAACGPRK